MLSSDSFWLIVNQLLIGDIIINQGGVFHQAELADYTVDWWLGAENCRNMILFGGADYLKIYIYLEFIKYLQQTHHSRNRKSISPLRDLRDTVRIYAWRTAK